MFLNSSDTKTREKERGNRGKANWGKGERVKGKEVSRHSLVVSKEQSVFNNQLGEQGKKGNG